jgi:hypothetical protein
MKKNPQIIFLIIVIILVGGSLVCLSKFLSNNNRHRLTSVPKFFSNEFTTPTTLPTTSKIIPSKPTTIIPKTPALSYTEAVAKYSNYRFQFYDNCSSATPSSFVVKSGSKFMIDNHEDKTHTFTFAKQKYAVKPYGYAIITAQTTGIQSVYCDGAPRATVEVAK